jgi:hypothetical protein
MMRKQGGERVVCVLPCQCICCGGNKRLKQTTCIIRVDEVLKAAVTKAARARDRPRAQLLRDYLAMAEAEHDAWFRAEVEQGLQELADPAIEPIPHRQIVEEREAEKADLLARMAPAKHGR